jgi:3-hydroxy-3-methylglutaryl CoA synthase
MVGITSINVYIPRYRLSWEEIGKMWRAKPGAGQKAVAGYDEDPITMGVAAVLDCLKETGQSVDGLYFATTTSPYKEKQGGALIAAAADLDRTCRSVDFTNSLRAATSAMRAALDAVTGGSAGQILVVASDCRVGAPKGRLEQLLGDGAAALTVGSKDTLAIIEDVYSVFSGFTDFWRRETDVFPRSAESRFVSEAGYVPVMEETISGLMKRHSLAPGDISKIVFTAVDSREHGAVAKKLGFEKAQVQDLCWQLATPEQRRRSSC